MSEENNNDTNYLHVNPCVNVSQHVNILMHIYVFLADIYYKSTYKLLNEYNILMVIPLNYK